MLDGKTQKGAAPESSVPKGEGGGLGYAGKTLRKRMMGMETWKGFPRTLNPIPCCAEQPQHLLLALWSSVGDPKYYRVHKGIAEIQGGWVHKCCHEEFVKLVERPSKGNPCAAPFLVIFLTLPTAGDLMEETKWHKEFPRSTRTGPSEQGRLQASSC